MQSNLLIMKHLTNLSKFCCPPPLQKLFIIIVLCLGAMVAFSQSPSWLATTGLLYTNPNDTKVSIGDNLLGPSSLTIKRVSPTGEDFVPFHFLRMQMQLGTATANNWDWIAGSSYHLSLMYNNQAHFNFANDGRMGINTQVASGTTLNVKGISRFIETSSATTTEINGNKINVLGTAQHLRLLDNNTTGTNKLIIRGVTEVLQPDNTSNFIRFQHDGANARIDGYGAGLLLVNYGNPTQKVVFQPDVKVAGNLMVDTDSNTDGADTYKLSVNGKIRAKEVKCYTTWADFVFEPNYKLMPLQQVKDFTQEHKHLPDIPSEKEVTQKGIHLGEMNAKLLQKIEELYLYIFQLEDRIKQLEKTSKN